MSKRLKRVFNNDQLAHVWAQQTQDSGRNVKDSMLFEGDSIYSYGSHFKLARICASNGRTIVLLNNRSYSTSTNRHQSSVSRAIDHLEHYDVSNPDNVLESIHASANNIADSLFSFFLQNKPCTYSISALMRQVAEHNKLSMAFNYTAECLEVCPEHYEVMQEYYLEREERKAQLNLPELVAKREAQASKRDEAKQRKLKAELALLIYDWKQGGQRSYKLNQIEPQLIRIYLDEVQTSGGASVPLKEALELFTTIEAGKAKKGDRVGYFTFDAVKNNRVYLGCHTIDLDEARTVLGSVSPKLKLAVEAK